MTCLPFSFVHFVLLYIVSKLLSDGSQAQDSSEMRKKQLKTKIEEANEPKQEKDRDGDNAKKVSSEAVGERTVVKEADKKVGGFAST